MAEQFRDYPQAIEFRVSNGLGFLGLQQKGTYDCIAGSWHTNNEIGLQLHLGLMDYQTGKKDEGLVRYINVMQDLIYWAAVDENRRNLLTSLSTPLDVEGQVLPILERKRAIDELSRTIGARVECLRQEFFRRPILKRVAPGLCFDPSTRKFTKEPIVVLNKKDYFKGLSRD